jgi:dTDP-4-dehydrorhamnose reductase
MKSSMSSYRVAVTGGDGQLGNEIAKIAGKSSVHQFTFLSRKEFPLEDFDLITKWLNQNPVDIFIHCAAYTAVDKAEAEKEKAFKVNAEAPGFIAAAIAKTNTRLIYISTDYVFDGTSSSPLKEDALTSPLNIYGASKLKGEQLVLRNNPLTQIIRTSWLYSEFGNNFVKTMLRLMKERHSLNIVNDQKGSPTYAGDLANIIMKIVETDHFQPGIFHFSNEGETTWFGFALEIKKLTGISCNILPIPTSEFPTAAKRPAYSLLDCSKIKKEYNLIIPDWQTSLANCIELLKKGKV